MVVYATDHSKAGVPVLFLFCVALWLILRGALCFIVFPCTLSSCFFILFFSIVITSLGAGGAHQVCVLLVHLLFVLYVLVFVLFLFLSVSGVGCGL